MSIQKPPTGGNLTEVFEIARALKQASGFLPSHLRNEGEIVAVLLAGRELGLPPMVSIRCIRLIKGNVSLDASLQLGMMVSAGVRYRWLKDGSDGVEAVLELTRDGQAPHISRYTWAMAERARLTGGENWQKHPAAMLRARAVSAAGKAYMPDVLAGVYVPGELDEEPAPVALTVVPRHQEPPQEPREAPKALPSPTSPTEPAPAPQAGVQAILEMHLPKLRARKTEAELVDWLRQVSAQKYALPYKRALWAALESHAKNLKLSPEKIAARAAAPETAETAPTAEETAP